MQSICKGLRTLLIKSRIVAPNSLNWNTSIQRGFVISVYNALFLTRYMGQEVIDSKFNLYLYIWRKSDNEFAVWPDAGLKQMSSSFRNLEILRFFFSFHCTEWSIFFLNWHGMKQMKCMKINISEQSFNKLLRLSLDN